MAAHTLYSKFGLMGYTTVDLVAHFTNIHISNSTIIFLSDEDLVQAKSESFTDPNQATADTTPPPSPSPSADSHTGSSTMSEFKDLELLVTGPTLTLNNHDSTLVPRSRCHASHKWHRGYCGYYYCVPAPTAPPPYYMVTKGLHVGIFSGW